MTEIQYLHHAEQMDAVRKEFEWRWTNEFEQQACRMTPRERVQFMSKVWKALRDSRMQI